MADTSLSRKRFLKIAGTSAAALWGLAGCELNSIPADPEPELNLGPDPNPDDDAIYIGSGDTALFNLFYAAEQLEAAFFTQVVENPYQDITNIEQRILGDIQQHEIAHRDFFNAFLGENSIPELNFEFQTQFEDRERVLQKARLFQDVSVSMYNNAGEYFTNTDYLSLSIKINSVEARHASAIRNLLQPESDFFIGDDIIDPNGLDVVNRPVDVHSILSAFIVEELDIRNLPSS